MSMAELARPSDPCAEPPSFLWSRFILFTVDFLIFIPGSAALFIILSDRQYGVQAASLVCYTAAVILYTFSRNRGLQRYLFNCPFVCGQLPRLAFRHACFLVALFVLQTLALRIRPHLPPFWLKASGGYKSMPPFVTALMALCVVLCLSEILTNRSLLDRAHRESEAN
jgi:lysylphosphatidylglycerol synthetase-like protein (DUF2156 family)